MTKNQTSSLIDSADTKFMKLSIQVSLNGLSFCVTDGVTNKVLTADETLFEKKQQPATILDTLKELLSTHNLTQLVFDEVFVIHKTNEFGLVPKSLFNPDYLTDYVKLNASHIATSPISYDEIEHQEIINVYAPLANITSYIKELFGAFSTVHIGSLLIGSLLNKQNLDTEKTCYAYVSRNQLDLIIVSHKKLLLYNSFEYHTKEDFIYYLLFVLEQLELDPNKVPVKLFGRIEEDDDLHQLCFTYIKNVSIYVASIPILQHLNDPNTSYIDFS